MIISLQEAKKIAREYLEKKGYEECSIEDIQDKITKWDVSLSDNNGSYLVEVAKSSGAVIGFMIKSQ